MAGDSLLFLLSLGVSETLLVERTHPLDGPQAVWGPRQGRFLTEGAKPIFSLPWFCSFGLLMS